MGEFFESTLNFLFAHYSLLEVILMALFMSIICLILNFAKKPIKKLTSKIENEKIRKLANKSIIVLSFILAIGLWFALHWIFPAYIVIDWVEILATGMLPVVGYAFFDGVIKGSAAKRVVIAIREVAEDGTITKEEAIKIFKEFAKLFDLIEQNEQSEKKVESEKKETIAIPEVVIKEEIPVTSKDEQKEDHQDKDLNDLLDGLF